MAETLPTYQFYNSRNASDLANIKVILRRNFGRCSFVHWLYGESLWTQSKL